MGRHQHVHRTKFPDAMQGERSCAISYSHDYSLGGLGTGHRRCELLRREEATICS